jgi:ubiquinone/menaquinone biosynthesis C-methylase UbiE
VPYEQQLALSLAGLALLRNWLVGDEARVAATLAETKRLAAVAGGEWTEYPYRDVALGYDEWSETYDTRPNPVIQLEAPAVDALLAEVPAGIALDAACGTGRHSATLHRLGHRVIGVDASEAMLAKARAKAHEADFRLGRLEQLPVDDASVDLAVCSLALTHVAELTRPVVELARVLRPGGRLVISDVHPAWVVLGAQALYRDSGGGLAWVRNHVHWPGAYLAAFQRAGLTVRSCQELPFGQSELELATPTGMAPDVAADALVGLPAVVVWDLGHPGSDLA